jgi:DNA-binding transcriptional LysR family regulator
MRIPDLNLLIALDALLSEGSVSGAARKIHLSTSGMSHVLARIREAIGDPILVRTGNRLVPTARALEMREAIARLVAEASSLFLPLSNTCLSEMEREFVLRTPESTPIVYGAALVTELHREMPKSVLRFVPESDDDVASLREGRVHLDIGTRPHYGFEIRTETLFEQRLVGVVADSHSLLQDRITLQRFVAEKHVAFLHRGRVHGPIDIALSALKLKRSVSLVVPSAYGALMAVARTNLVATVPARLARRTQVPLDVHIFDLPLVVPADYVVQAWLPRFDADPAHQYLRKCVESVLTRNNWNVSDAGQQTVQDMNAICPLS